MTDDPTEHRARRWVDAGAFLALQQEVRDVRSLLRDEVRTRRVVLVDERGVGRIRMAAEGDICRIVLADRDGFERIALAAQPDIGNIVVSARGEGGPTRVDLFALDAEDRHDDPVAGVELVDGGNSVGGFTVYAGRDASLWTDPLVPRDEASTPRRRPGRFR